MSLRIDAAGERFPRFEHRLGAFESGLVRPAQFLPECAARLHAVIPRNMMKPQQQLFRALLEALKSVAQRRSVLSGRAAAAAGAVEPDAALVRLVVIGCRPIRARLRCVPRLRSLTVAADQVM